MPRIRSIKPEFWADEKMARELTRDQRLFYVALWNEADDEGRFIANARRLLGVVFPYDDDVHESFIEDSLRALADTGRIDLYEVEGCRYGELTKFDEHQRINRPSPSKLPGPQDVTSFTEGSWRAHGGLMEGSPPEQGAGSREVEQGTGSLTPAARAGRADWRSDEVGGWNGADVLGAFVEYCQSQGWPRPPDGEMGKLGAAGKRLAEKHAPSSIVRAMLGMGGLYPHSKGEPWDLFDLERKFTKASAAATQVDEVQEAAFDAAFRRAG